MPIYEYQCQKCGKRLEKRQSITEEPLKVCEECGGELIKMVSLSGFQFKGGGWYVTDYAGKTKAVDKKPENSAEKSTQPESTTSPESASNSKNATPAKADTSKSTD